MKQLWSDKNELLNFLSHLVGCILTLIASYFLLIKNNNIILIIYCCSMFLMFLASTLYHATTYTKYHHFLQKIDHGMIYVFIFATYLPFSYFLNTKKAYIILGIVFISCVIGFILKLFFAGQFKKLSTIIYLIIGWLVIFEINDLLIVLPTNSLFFLTLGGVLYTLGSVVYLAKKLKYQHFIWHIFVLLASFSQFISVYILF